MSHSLKSLILCSCLFTGFFVAADFNRIEAAQGRWGAYNNEQAAWGGNGGWWGGGSTDWYGDNGNNNYYFDNEYPYGQHYYGEPGTGASAGVNGSGYYFNVRAY